MEVIGLDTLNIPDCGDPLLPVLFTKYLGNGRNVFSLWDTFIKDPDVFPIGEGSNVGSWNFIVITYVLRVNPRIILVPDIASHKMAIIFG